MYVQGVSTRKVAAITEQLCGFEVSSSQVSGAAAALDEQLSAWRSRPLGEQATPYLLLDARYEKVRRGGLVQDAAVRMAAVRMAAVRMAAVRMAAVRMAAVRMAVGIGVEGKGRILGVSVAISEHEVHWREFLRGLLERGLLERGLSGVACRGWPVGGAADRQ